MRRMGREVLVLGLHRRASCVVGGLVGEKDDTYWYRKNYDAALGLVVLCFQKRRVHGGQTASNILLSS